MVESLYRAPWEEEDIWASGDMPLSSMPAGQQQQAGWPMDHTESLQHSRMQIIRQIEQMERELTQNPRMSIVYGSQLNALYDDLRTIDQYMLKEQTAAAAGGGSYSNSQEYLDQRLGLDYSRLGLDQSKFGHQQNQDALNFGLSQDKFGLDQNKFGLDQDKWAAAQEASRWEREEKWPYQQERDRISDEQKQQDFGIRRNTNNISLFDSIQGGALKAAPMLARPGQKYHTGFEPGGVYHRLLNWGSSGASEPYNPDPYSIVPMEFNQEDMWEKARRMMGG